MRNTNAETAAVIIIMSTFSIWSVWLLASLPFSVGEESRIRELERRAPLAQLQIDNLADRHFAGQGISLAEIEHLLSSEQALGTFPVDQDHFLAGGRRSLNLVLAFGRFDPDLGSLLAPLKSLCKRPILRCLILFPDGTENAKLQKHYLPFFPELPTWLVSETKLNYILPKSQVKEIQQEKRAKALVFLENGRPFFELSSSPVAAISDSVLVTQTLATLLGDPSLLQATHPSSDPPPQGQADGAEETAPHIEQISNAKETVASGSPEETQKPTPTESQLRGSETPQPVDTKQIEEQKEAKPPRLKDMTHPIYNLKNGIKTTLATWIANQKKPVALNFWATYCIPCRQELQMLSRLSSEYKGILFVGLVDGDLTPESYAEIRHLVLEKSVNYPQYIFPSSQVQVDIVGVTAIPSFAVFNRSGTLVGSFSGSIKEHEDLYDRLIMLLDEVSR